MEIVDHIAFALALVLRLMVRLLPEGHVLVLHWSHRFIRYR